jgi:DNA polymerase III gamma/tau subunit
LQEIARKEELKIEPGALTVIARMAEGSLRDALSLLEQARAYCGDAISDKEVRDLLGVVPDEALEELVEAIAEGSADGALGLVHRFQKEGRNLQHFCREAIRHMRNLLIARVCGADSDLIAATPDQRPALAKAAAKFSEEDLTRFFQILLQTDDDLRRKPDPRVHLEMGLLRLINAARLAPLEELIAELSAGESAKGPKVAARRTAGAPPNVPSASIPNQQAESPASAEAAHGRPALPAGIGTTTRATASDAKPGDGATRIVTASGISAEQIAEIRAEIQAQQKFLGELIEHAHRWELDDEELKLYFAGDKRAFAEMIESRDAKEKMRAVSSKVLGRSVRVCAKIETVAAAAASASHAGAGTQELRAQFERDPLVRSMLQRFGGKISEVKRREGES